MDSNFLLYLVSKTFLSDMRLLASLLVCLAFSTFCSGTALEAATLSDGDEAILCDLVIDWSEARLEESSVHSSMADK